MVNKSFMDLFENLVPGIDVLEVEKGITWEIAPIGRDDHDRNGGVYEAGTFLDIKEVDFRTENIQITCSRIIKHEDVYHACSVADLCHILIDKTNYNSLTIIRYEHELLRKFPPETIVITTNRLNAIPIPDQDYPEIETFLRPGVFLRVIQPRINILDGMDDDHCYGLPKSLQCALLDDLQVPGNPWKDIFGIEMIITEADIYKIKSVNLDESNRAVRQLEDLLKQRDIRSQNIMFNKIRE